LLDGTVDEHDDRIKARVHLEDAATHTILWSEEFERPASESGPLQAEIAAKATTMAAYALAAKPAGLTDPVLADYISANEHIRFDWSGGLQAAEPILRRVIERAPRFAGGHGSLSDALAFQALIPGNPRAAEQRAEATREANRAIALDPRGFGAYGALAILRPSLDWRGREALFEEGMAHDPSNAGEPYVFSGLLAQAGRLQAATEMARRGVALDPLWPGPTWSLGMRLLDAGRQNEGLATFDRMAEIWPRHEATRIGRFWARAMYGDPDDALTLLADARTIPPDLDTQGVMLWRQYLSAIKSGGLADMSRAATAIESGERSGALGSGPAMVMLSRLGDIDGAFAAADRYVDRFASYEPTGPPFLFIAATGPMRRDPRFMRLVARLGLVDYWRSSGHWPDFCSEPGLAYNCRAEASKDDGKPMT
jgi:tetratricopeptide (TPR) repeat protein